MAPCPPSLLSFTAIVTGTCVSDTIYVRDTIAVLSQIPLPARIGDGRSFNWVRTCREGEPKPVAILAMILQSVYSSVVDIHPITPCFR